MTEEPKIQCEYCINNDESMLEVNDNHPQFIYIFCNVCGRTTIISKIQTPLEPLGADRQSDR